MKATLLVLLISMLVVGGCRKIGGCTPEKHEYNFSSGKTIDTTRASFSDLLFTYYGFSVNNGNSNVFTYVKYYKDCPEIADDEGSLTILFEAPPVNNFIIKDSLQLLQAKCLIYLRCECFPNAPLMVKKGSIEGTRLADNKWQIKLDLKMPWNSESGITFDKTFTQ